MFLLSLPLPSPAQAGAQTGALEKWPVPMKAGPRSWAPAFAGEGSR